MAHPGFGHLWKQSEMSDIDIVIACPVDEGSGGDDAHMLENSTLLQQIPGHSPILSLSPYLKAQASFNYCCIIAAVADPLCLVQWLLGLP